MIVCYFTLSLNKEGKQMSNATKLETLLNLIVCKNCTEQQAYTIAIMITDLLRIDKNCIKGV